jgi:hypothetical protein
MVKKGSRRSAKFAMRRFSRPRVPKKLRSFVGSLYFKGSNVIPGCLLHNRLGE